MSPNQDRPQRDVRRERRAMLALLLTTFIWGATFVWNRRALDAGARVLGADGVAATTLLYIATRFTIAAVLIAIVVPMTTPPNARRLDGGLLRDAGFLGVLVTSGFALQLMGASEVTPAVSAFLTSLYVGMTALAMIVIHRALPSVWTIVGVALATFGASFVGGPPQLSFNFGARLTVVSAMVFSVHILATDRVMKRRAPMPTTVATFAVVSVLCWGALAVLTMTSSHITARGLGSLAIDAAFVRTTLYAAVFGSALALAVMNVFQRDLGPVRSAILYALEPVWAALIAWRCGVGTPDRWLWVGGGALLIGNIVVEIGPRLFTKAPPKCYGAA